MSKVFVLLIINLAIAFCDQKYAIADKKLTPEGSMPVIGLGTWQARGGDVERALNIALEAGYRHIDTAYIYNNEAEIGKVLKQWLDSGKLKREDIFIVTKLPPSGMQKDQVEKYLNSSLNSLGLQYVDLYLIHSPRGYRVINGQRQPNNNVDHLGIWSEMERMVELGKTKAIGLSNYDESQIENIRKHAKIQPSNLQVELHTYYQQKPLVKYCDKNNITVTAYSPLGSPGTNSKSYDKNNVLLPWILKHPVVEEIAKKNNKTPAQVVLRHALQNGLIVIPKSTNEGRIKENLNLYDFELDQIDMEKLNNLDQGVNGKLT